jgi:membrane protein
MRRWRTVKRVVTGFRNDNITDWAAALTYYAVLAIFPAMIALISMLGIVVDRDTIVRVVTDTVNELGPASAVDTFADPIESIASNQATAGVLLIVGLVTAVWTASGYVGAFMRASNSIYEREERRPFWKLRPLQLVLTLVLVLLAALVVLALIVSGPVAEAIGSAVGLGDTTVTIWQYAKWPVLLVVVMFMLAVLFWSASNAGFRWLSPGSVLAVVLWVAASAGFAVYVANFGSYDKTYGTLGGVIVFLVWMWITNVAVLLGVEINAETERLPAAVERGGGGDDSTRVVEVDRDEARPKEPVGGASR